MTEIPVKNHRCQAIDTIETLSGKVEFLQKHIRYIEEKQNDINNKILIKIAVITTLLTLSSTEIISFLGVLF